MKNCTWLLYLYLSLPLSLKSQLYLDASANLPDNGAKGPSMDVQAADLDGDGDVDIVLANEFQANAFLLNDGSGHFSKGISNALATTVHDSEDVAIADYNNDGWPDLVFCSEDDFVHEFYLNDSNGNFAKSSFQFPNSEANAVISADINGDGFPDLLFGNNGFNSALINNSAEPGTFTSENARLPQVNRTTQDLALADVDGDGDLDLMEGNENGNLLHINDGTGHFSDETSGRLPQGLNIETRKLAFGDVDGDNDSDVFLCNVAFIPGKQRQNLLFLNDGSGHFSNATPDHLPADNDHTIDAIFEDVELDGDLDLVVCNVFGAHIKIYANDGSGHFSDATQAVLGQEYYRDALGVVAEDFNGDGLRDLYICDRKMPQANTKDLLLLRQPLSVAIVQDKVAPFAILYPNPVRDRFFIKTNLEGVDSVRLLDNAGRMVKMLEVQEAGSGILEGKLGGAKLASGMYYVEIQGARTRFLILP